MVRFQLKNKSGQLKIQQMAFMLIAVTLFLALVGLFVVTILFSGLKESSALLEEENALLLVSKLANSPEFLCGGDFGVKRADCVDFDKIMALKNNIRSYSDADFWGVEGIEIVKVYPIQGNQDILCTSDNYPNCNKIEIIKASSGTGVSNFVALCRKQNNLQGQIINFCELAKLIVTYKEVV